MKKLIFIVGILILFACQEGDKIPQIKTVNDPITGYWLPRKTVKIYGNNDSIVKTFNDCGNPIPSHLYFHNTIRKDFFIFFRQEINADSCHYSGGSGNWNLIEQNTYQVDVKYFPESDYKSNLVENLVYKIDFISNDSIHIHDADQLLELQNEEPNVIDVYNVFEYRDKLFD